MPGVVSADLFERVIPMLPQFSTFERQKHFQFNTYLERLAQNVLIITMVSVMVLFANDVFDVGYYVVCYENETLVRKKDITLCIENMKPSNEPQAPEYLMMRIGKLLVCMFSINRVWEFYFQNYIRQHVEEVIFEINDSVYRAMMVNINENTPQHKNRNRIYKKILTLNIEDISPMDTCKRWLIVAVFIIKNLAYCSMALGHIILLQNMVKSYEHEKQKCDIDNRNLVCTIPEYHTLKSIQQMAVTFCIIIIHFLVLYVCFTLSKDVRGDSFLKVYNSEIIPHYSYRSLNFQSHTPAWGIILLYLKENDFLLTHYQYLRSLCTLQEFLDFNETNPLFANRRGLNLLKGMKQQVLIDEFSREWSDRSQSQDEPDHLQNWHSI